MNDLQEYKEEFEKKFYSLSEKRQEQILTYYDVYRVSGLIRMARNEAQKVKDYADRKMYGYGEVSYNIEQYVIEFESEVPELKNEYKHLIYEYFDLLTVDIDD